MFGVIAVLLSGAVPIAWMLQPVSSAGPCVVVKGPAMLPEIPETSGLATSRRASGVLWSHNDSGNAAVLFALDATGTVHGRVRVPVLTLDWEDISAAACPAGDCLYIADIGDNALIRPQIFIYRVAEPGPTEAEAAPVEVFTARYADGAHNAESLFVIGEDLFIVTRDRTGVVYRARPLPSGHRELTFERVGALGLPSVTDAETARDGRFVVVRTSREAVLYKSADVIRNAFVPYFRIPIGGLREPQGEGVALDGNLLYLSSEGRRWNTAGRIVTLRCELPS